MRELINECTESRAAYRALHKDRARLEKLKEAEHARIEVLNTKASNLQLHKFGRIVDLDSLEVDMDGSNEDPSDAAARSARSRNLAEVMSLENESDEIKATLSWSTSIPGALRS